MPRACPWLQFRSPPDNEGMQVIQCTTCLNPGHSALECTLRMHCPICHSRAHTLELCEYNLLNRNAATVRQIEPQTTQTANTAPRPAPRESERPRPRDRYRDDNRDWEEDYYRDEDYMHDDANCRDHDYRRREDYRRYDDFRPRGRLSPWQQLRSKQQFLSLRGLRQGR